ncbi:hypothetical protein BJ165DRAFT_1423824 [Panaeolus papilionaceus]|nr:hypothetical protein BJ165DRAFT_1423824 [Panaeolus papilionaceus]
MPPTLRSAQNSPAGKSARQDLPTPTLTPTRKVPQCSHCKRPRAGHPRSGCPYMDSPVNKDFDDALISGALQSLNIETHRTATNEEQKPRIHQTRSHQPKPLRRSNTQLALATTSNEMVGHLSQSGIFDNPQGDMLEMKAKVAKIVRWQDAVTPASPKANKPLKPGRPSRSPMPGTLIPPSPFSSYDSLDTESDSQGAVHSILSEQGQKPISSSSVSQPQPQARPLTRSMSAMERDLFIARLSCDAPATVYVVPKVDMDSILQQAKILKFFTAQIMNEENDQDDQALLIIGQTESAVQTLLKKIEAEHSKFTEKQPVSTSSKPSSNFKVVAGSALVGAVGAWAGLAFS